MAKLCEAQAGHRHPRPALVGQSMGAQGDQPQPSVPGTDTQVASTVS